MFFLLKIFGHLNFLYSFVPFHLLLSMLCYEEEELLTMNEMELRFDKIIISSPEQKAPR